MTKWEEEQAVILEEARRKEELRIESIQTLIGSNFDIYRANKLQGSAASVIKDLFRDVESLDVTEEIYQEFTTESFQKKAELTDIFIDMHSKAVDAEQEDERRKDEDDRLKEERKKLEAERDRIAGENRKITEEQERIRQQQEEDQRRIDAEKKAIADNKAKMESERLATEQAEKANQAAAEAAEKQHIQEEADAKAKAECEEVLRPDKKKLVVYVRTLETSAITEAEKLKFDSDDIRHCVVEFVLGVSALCDNTIAHCGK
ncbi:hypothetical protein [Candidatus Vondammii sp. HM_W22]|uniref:hypothetical protein n=1 Tax=Candidatus Vondammii sp. HM_W22 TaxID=2687299 RepID=UPI001F130F9E|nr:hypothetical protein [Candidatus Vondammii sp. HM_W22]